MADGSSEQDTIDDSISPEGQADTMEVADEDNTNHNGITEIESLCMNCQDDGITRLKLLHIPFFHEVLLESFSCENCGHADSTIKPAGKIQEGGSKFTFRLDSDEDFQRQVMRNDSSIFKVEDLDLEMPSGPGQLTNLEGLLTKILVELQADQPQRKKDDATLYEGLERVLQKLTSMVKGTCFPFTVSLNDPSGNSSIEPSPSDQGTKYTRTDYARTHAQNVLLGLATDEEHGASERVDPMCDVDLVDGEIYEVPSPCPGCSKDCTINIKKVEIPHFKEVIIMSTVCDHCGYTTREVKTGGDIPEKGGRTTLRVESVADLTRDVLKSETCALKIPELGLEVQAGTLGGRFTTVEGLLSQVMDQLHGQIFDVQNSTTDGNMPAGDSMPAGTREKWDEFFTKLKRAASAEMKYSIVLEDPLANSYVQKVVDEGAEGTDDRQLVMESYERTAEENDELGLVHMNTEQLEAEDDKEAPRFGVDTAAEAQSQQGG